jgi:hypothetical protein
MQVSLHPTSLPLTANMGTTSTMPKSRNAKAQKAHRERRAVYIKRLEDRVLNLESRLATADAISMENDRLRGELASMVKVLAPLTDEVLHSTFGPATPASLISDMGGPLRCPSPSPFDTAISGDSSDAGCFGFDTFSSSIYSNSPTETPLTESVLSSALASPDIPSSSRLDYTSSLSLDCGFKCHPHTLHLNVSLPLLTPVSNSCGCLFARSDKRT